MQEKERTQEERKYVRWKEGQEEENMMTRGEKC